MHKIKAREKGGNDGEECQLTNVEIRELEKSLFCNPLCDTDANTTEWKVEEWVSGHPLTITFHVQEEVFPLWCNDLSRHQVINNQTVHNQEWHKQTSCAS